MEGLESLLPLSIGGGNEIRLLEVLTAAQFAFPFSPQARRSARTKKIGLTLQPWVLGKLSFDFITPSLLTLPRCFRSRGALPEQAGVFLKVIALWKTFKKK